MQEPQDSSYGARGPIFIIGAKGSGTTLMRLILDSHPNIAIPPETGFARTLRAQRYVPFWRFGNKWWRKVGWTDEDFIEHLRGFYDTIFRKYAAEHGKKRWGEKTPFHVWHCAGLREVFPDARFIGMVRHPGGNVGSLRGRFNYSVAHGIGHWSTATRELIYAAKGNGDAFLLCRYEDLVLRPEQTMREVLEWLEEPWAQAVLEHHTVQRERGAPEKVEGRTRPDDAIDVKRVSKWTRELGERAKRRVESETGSLAAFFGYNGLDPVPSGPLGRVDGRILSTGDEVAQRLAALPQSDKISRPKRPLRDRRLNPRHIGVHATFREPEARHGAETQTPTNTPRGKTHQLVRRVKRRVRRVARAARGSR